MSNVLNAMTLATAETAAVMLQRILTPHCDRCIIAGSIRRQKQTVNDIELVVIPKLDLDGGKLVDRLDDFFKQVSRDDHRCLKRPVFSKTAGRNPPWGPRYKKLFFLHTNRWLPVDVWITSPERFGSILAIRTGDSDFSRLLVTRTQYGGAMPPHLRQANGQLEELVPTDRYETAYEWRALPTPGEDDFFGALGLPTLTPCLRSEKNLRALIQEHQPTRTGRST